jgi:hypothetical protein
VAEPQIARVRVQKRGARSPGYAVGRHANGYT